MHVGFPIASAEERQPVHHVVLEEERAEVCNQEDQSRPKQVKSYQALQVGWVGATLNLKVFSYIMLQENLENGCCQEERG